jgi:hypothetical protein
MTFHNHTKSRDLVNLMTIWAALALFVLPCLSRVDRLCAREQGFSNADEILEVFARKLGFESRGSRDVIVMLDSRWAHHESE